MKPAALRLGIQTLLSDRREWVEGKTVGLVSHPAAVDGSGATTAELLHRARDVRLAALFGPEHGFFGAALAGESVRSAVHPEWGIPIHSLYGPQRKPTPEMLGPLDVMVLDLRNIPVRPYTYVSTLRYVMEACAENRKTLIVADRPVPLASVVDGPAWNPSCGSFVSCVPFPFAYGMTLGEAALALAGPLGCRTLVAPMKNYCRRVWPPPGSPPWVRPSPAIASPQSALCYASTVVCEAFPCLDHGRGTRLPFQVFGAPWLRASDLCASLEHASLPGVRFQPHAYRPARTDWPRSPIPGVRLRVTDPCAYRPARTAVALLHALQECHGRRRLWAAGNARGDFLDKLLGTPDVRRSLRDGSTPAEIVRAWEPALAAFRRTRRRFLLYPEDSGLQESPS